MSTGLFYPTANKPTSEEVLVIFSVREAYTFLEQWVSHYDRDPIFTATIIEMLVSDVIECEQMRDPVGSYHDSALQEVLKTGHVMETAHHVIARTGDLIIDAITAVLPDWGSDKYHNAYEYYISPPHTVYLHVHRGAFSAEGLAQIPRGRPYRL